MSVQVVQVDSTGVILSIGAVQPYEDAISIEIELTEMQMHFPERFRYIDGQLIEVMRNDVSD